MPVDGMNLDQARGFFQIRFFGALNAVSIAAKHIRPEGSITLTSGSARTRPGAGWSVASSLCGATTSLARALAVELAPIRVNLVEPGIVRSPCGAAYTLTTSRRCSTSKRPPSPQDASERSKTSHKHSCTQ